jgi:hypothetical protein
VILIERGLGIERIQVTHTSAHEKGNDILGARLEMRLLGRKGRRYTGNVLAALCQKAILIEQTGQRQTAYAFAGAK